MTDFQLVDQGCGPAYNIILKKGATRIGAKELKNEFFKDILCELIICDGNRVDVVNFERLPQRNSSVFINSVPISSKNNEMKVGDFLGFGSALSVAEYKELGGDEWQKCKLYQLLKLVPLEGGMISDEEYWSDTTEKLVEEDVDCLTEVLSVSEELDDLEIQDVEQASVPKSNDKTVDVSSPPKKCIITDPKPGPSNEPPLGKINSVEKFKETIDNKPIPEDTDAPYSDDDLSDFDPNYEGDKEKESCITTDSKIIVISSSDESDEPELPEEYLQEIQRESSESGIGESSSRSETSSPDGEVIWKVISDLKKPKFSPSHDYSYVVVFPTPPSSENENHHHASLQSKSTNKRNSAFSSSSDNDAEDDDKRKRTKKSKKNRTRKEPLDMNPENSSRSTSPVVLSPSSNKTPEKKQSEVPKPPSPAFKIDVNYERNNITPQSKTKLIDALPQNTKSHKGHKAPPIIPSTSKPSTSRNAPPNHITIERQYNKKFSNPKPKSVSDMRAGRAGIKEKLCELTKQKENSTEKPKVTAKVKNQSMSRNDMLFAEVVNQVPKTSNKQQEPKQGPSREY